MATTYPVCNCKRAEETVLTETESVCPECLQRIPAQRIAVGDDIYLRKTCPQHGTFQTICWRGRQAYETWYRPKLPVRPDPAFKTVRRGCPFDCGLCVDHLQQPCCVLLEVTSRCDLRCPVCFASSGTATPDPSLETIRAWYERILEGGGPFNIQLSGGEPSLRDDLPQIIAMGRELGFTYFQLNTNGLRIAREPEYLARLKEAGLTAVFLQFDGLDDDVYTRLRGARIFEKKMLAIRRCAELAVGVVLVPTLIPGVNTGQIGDIIRLALQHHPTVRTVHFQPVSYFGRFPQPPSDQDRITIPEVIRAISEQMDGAIAVEAFKPPSGEHALCSFHGNFVIMPDGALKPVTRHDSSCCSRPQRDGARKTREFVARHWQVPKISPGQVSLDPEPLNDWDTFLERARTHLFTLSGMAFQDAWNLDLERLRECCVLTFDPDGYLVPFCAYNLTNRQGRALYRKT